MITVTDLFCGAGGSGLGATSVPGVELYMAANHSPRAIETHAANFPDVEHDCADISQVEPRRYRRTNILWASPECTNHSVAKGKKRRSSVPSLFDEPVPDHVAERSRATMWDVPRFAEVHRYDAVIVENVVDAAAWEAFPAWLMAMQCLGYEYQPVFLNSMHAPAINAPRAPQSRDRMYVVFWRKGNRAPDLDIRPRGRCEHCGLEVECRQSWKARGKTWPLPRWGRYRAQYVYTCTTPGCGRQVEPYALPAAAVIDWSDRGERIGARSRPLSEKTLARIRAGLERHAQPITLEAAGNTFERRPGVRTWPVDGPTPTLTTTATRALACPPLLVPSGGSRNETAVPVGVPFRTRTTTEWEALLVPYYSSTEAAQPVTEPVGTLSTRDRYGLAFIAELRGGGSTSRPVTDPLATVCASGTHHMLVRHNTVKGDPGYLSTSVGEPMRTLTTAGHQSLVGWPAEPPTVEDCTFRMLGVPEIQAAMAFTPDYVITGNRGEQVRQLGNGVTPPAAEWLIRAVVESLGAAA